MRLNFLPAKKIPSVIDAKKRGGRNSPLLAINEISSMTTTPPITKINDRYS